MERIIKRIKELYVIALNKIIPQKALIIKSICPLHDHSVPASCKDRLQITIITPDDSFDFEDLLDYHFRAVADHLKAKHNINFFVGLEYKTKTGRYTFIGKPPESVRVFKKP